MSTFESRWPKSQAQFFVTTKIEIKTHVFMDSNIHFLRSRKLSAITNKLSLRRSGWFPLRCWGNEANGFTMMLQYVSDRRWQYFELSHHRCGISTAVTFNINETVRKTQQAGNGRNGFAVGDNELPTQFPLSIAFVRLSELFDVVWRDRHC